MACYQRPFWVPLPPESPGTQVPTHTADVVAVVVASDEGRGVVIEEAVERAVDEGGPGGDSQPVDSCGKPVENSGWLEPALMHAGRQGLCAAGFWSPGWVGQ